MRIWPLLLLLTSLPATAGVRLVTPLDGSQVAGATTIEAAVDTAGVNRVEFLVDGRLVAVIRTPPYRHLHDFGVETAAHTIAAVVHSNGFKTREEAKVTTLPLTMSDEVVVNLVEVPLAVRARRPLTTSDVMVRENGVPQTLSEIRNSRGATHFVFVVDRSLSMRGGKFEAAIAAIDHFRAKLNPDDSASIITFNHRVDSQRALRPRAGTAATLDRAAPSGGTSLRDALVSAKRSGRTVMITISDGADRNSATGVDATRLALGARDVTLYALLFANGSAAELLRDVARRTGGGVRQTEARRVSRDLDSILAELNSRHVAVYQSSGGARGWRSIEVKSRRRDVAVATARKGYFAQ